MVDKSISLENGVELPAISLGVFLIDETKMTRAVSAALDAGYVGFDTAHDYKNERILADALDETEMDRSDVFITTKLPNGAQRARQGLASFEESLRNLKTDYIDLYLLHWAIEDEFLHAWEEMIGIYESGRAKAIGVCNFMEHHLDALDERFDVMPVVNQFEHHPFLQRDTVLGHCSASGIVAQAHTPLTHGRLLEHPRLAEIGGAYEKTVAQLILRWNLQKSLAIVPKSATPSRIKENFEIWDFQISSEHMSQINDLHDGSMICLDPDNVTW